ncbi:MAG: paraquat-inducible membrane protein A [Methyloglobulus sp.]|nr:paraquat-inducible membrane protein A [Methyloglobulus sp.]
MKLIKSALNQGFIRCHDCGCLIKTKAQPLCPVCGNSIAARRHLSAQHTAALIISALCLYIPANIFPIMTVTELGLAEPHTIVGGIVVLVQSDMIPIALLVLVASILVPMMKLLGLTLLLLCVHYQWQGNARLFTRMYRIIAFVGRWSMLDIFMISILVALVDLGGVAQVIAGPAATAFAAVVVLTMFAAKSFDPRLLWDHQAT